MKPFLCNYMACKAMCYNISNILVENNVVITMANIYIKPNNEANLAPGWYRVDINQIVPIEKENNFKKNSDTLKNGN